MLTFFGSYNRDYSRHQILIKGLNALKVPYQEIHLEVSQLELNKDKHLGVFPLAYRFLRKLKIIPLLIRSWRQLKQSQVFFIPCPGHFDMLFTVSLARLLGKPIILDGIISLYQAVTTDFGIVSRRNWKAEFLKIYEKWMYDRADLVIVDTSLQKDYFQKVFKVNGSKIRVVPIGADDEIYPYKKYTHIRPFKVIYYGLYNPLHGINILIEAADRLRNIPGLEFIFIGKGQTYAESLDQIKKFKLKNIILYPDMTEKEAISTLASGHVFIGFLKNAPTVKRQIPNKVFQGIALGKVVLTADSPIIRSVFRHQQNIYLVPPENSLALAQAIRTLMQNPHLCRDITEKAYTLYRNSFMPVAIGLQIKEIINSLSREQYEGGYFSRRTWHPLK